MNLKIHRQHCYNCDSIWMSRTHDRIIGNWERVKNFIFGSEMDKEKLEIPVFKFKVRRPTGERRKDRIQKSPSCGIWLKNSQILIIIHCKPIPVKKTGFSLCNFSLCGKTTQGKLCSGPVLALYGIGFWHPIHDVKPCRKYVQNPGSPLGSTS